MTTGLKSLTTTPAPRVAIGCRLTVMRHFCSDALVNELGQASDCANDLGLIYEEGLLDKEL